MFGRGSARTPLWELIQCSPDSLDVLEGPTSKGEGEVMDRERVGEGERKERGRTFRKCLDPSC